MPQHQGSSTQTTDGQKTFFFTASARADGVIVQVFDHDPSLWTEPEDATATMTLEVEPGADATRVMLRLWDDETAKDGNALHIITLIELKHEDA